MGAVTSGPEVASEEALVVQAALDYVEGWFEGDAVRMERALHVELAKRSLDGDHVRTITARQMVDSTAEGVGKRRPSCVASRSSSSGSTTASRTRPCSVPRSSTTSSSPAPTTAGRS